MHWHGWSFRLRLRSKLLCFAFAVSVPLLLLSSFLLVDVLRQSRLVLAQTSMKEAQVASQALDSWYRDQITHLRLIGDIPDLMHAGPQAFRNLRRTADKLGIWSSLDWVDPDGNQQFSTRRHATTRTWRHARWFHRVLDTFQPNLSSELHRPDGRPDLLIALPLVRQGQLLGILVAHYPLERMAHHVLVIHPDSDRIVILDARGRLIASNLRGGMGFMGKVLNPRLREQGQEIRWVDGEVRSTSWARSPLTGWQVWIGTPPRAPWFLWEGIGALVALALLTSGSLAVWLASRLIRSLQQLSEAAIALSEGDLARRAIPDSADEVGNLARVFNVMAERLQNQQQGLEARAMERGVLLDKQRNLTQEILDHIPVVVFSTDPAGRLLLANPEARRSLGLRVQDVGRPIEELLAPALAVRIRDWIDRTVASARPVTMYEEPIHNPLDPAQMTYWDSRYQPLKGPEERLEGVLVVAMNVTDQVLMRQKLREQLEQVRQLDQMKMDFLATIHHELRTPLSLIMGFGSNLADELLGELTPAQREAVNKMLEGVGHLAGLVNELIDVHDVTSGRMSIASYPIEMGPLIEASWQHFQAICAARKQRIILDVDPDLPAAYADPNRVEQILRHLLSNACKFTPEGGEIQIGCHLQGDRLCTEVSDTGIGILPEALPQLFSQFYQVESTATRRYGGMGVGLYLVKRLLDAMGGTVEVQSTPGQGSRFTFCLPAVLQAGQAPTGKLP